MILRRFLSDTPDKTIVQMFRYVFAGALAFITDFGLLVFFTEISGIHYLVSAALSFCVAVTVSYVMCTKWVFHKRRLENVRAEFTVFFIIGAVGLFLNEAVLYFLTENASLHYMVSKIFSSLIVSSWNFFGKKYILYN
ncbi:MAG: GtrA family protein [Fibrobacterota bacterium]